MPQIAVRLSDDEITLIDRLVAEQHFASRADVVRGALAKVAKEREDREIAEEYRRAYEGKPVDQEDLNWAVAGAKLLAESLADDPPWDFDDDEDDDFDGPTIERLELMAVQMTQIVQEIVARRERRRP